MPSYAYDGSPRSHATRTKRERSSQSDATLPCETIWAAQNRQYPTANTYVPSRSEHIEAFLTNLPTESRSEDPTPLYHPLTLSRVQLKQEPFFANWKLHLMQGRLCQGLPPCFDIQSLPTRTNRHAIAQSPPPSTRGTNLTIKKSRFSRPDSLN